MRSNQTLENYLKISVGIDVSNPMKYIKIQITDKTIFESGNQGPSVSAYWKNICNDYNKNGKISLFVKTMKTNCLTGISAATILPPIWDIFMYIETSSKNQSNIGFVIFERADTIQHNNILFYYDTFSI